MTTHKALRRWIKSKMVVNMEKLSKILDRHKTKAVNYFELTKSGAILFKAPFDGRYLISCIFTGQDLSTDRGTGR